MPGTPAQTSYAARPGMFALNTILTGAVTGGQVLGEWVFPWSAGRIAGMEFNAGVAGTGGGSTVLGIAINGTPIFGSGTPPTLAATSTGRFTQTPPPTRALKYGDLITVSVTTVSTTGHARVSGSLAVEGQ